MACRRPASCCVLTLPLLCVLLPCSSLCVLISTCKKGHQSDQIRAYTNCPILTYVFKGPVSKYSTTLGLEMKILTHKFWENAVQPVPTMHLVHCRIIFIVNPQTQPSVHQLKRNCIHFSPSPLASSEKDCRRGTQANPCVTSKTQRSLSYHAFAMALRSIPGLWNRSVSGRPFENGHNFKMRALTETVIVRGQSTWTVQAGGQEESNKDVVGCCFGYPQCRQAPELTSHHVASPGLFKTGCPLG